RAGASNTDLHLVEAQERRERRGRRDELLLERKDAALAENRLEQDEPDLVVDRSCQRRGVVRRHQPYTRHERHELLALRGLPGDRERPERAPVKTALERDDAGLPGRLARVLQRGLDGLRARVAEERLGAAEARGQERRELLRRLGAI